MWAAGAAESRCRPSWGLAATPGSPGHPLPPPQLNGVSRSARGPECHRDLPTNLAALSPAWPPWSFLKCSIGPWHGPQVPTEQQPWPEAGRGLLRGHLQDCQRGPCPRPLTRGGENRSLLTLLFPLPSPLPCMPDRPPPLRPLLPGEAREGCGAPSSAAACDPLGPFFHRRGLQKQQAPVYNAPGTSAESQGRPQGPDSWGSRV